MFLPLLHRNALYQIFGLIYIAAPCYCNVIRGSCTGAIEINGVSGPSVASNLMANSTIGLF
jgi:hypothetical protein